MTLDPILLLNAYAAGIFPMADSREAKELYWVEPNERAIIPLDGFHVSRSLRRTLRSGRFEVSRDRAFTEVVQGCADRGEGRVGVGVVPGERGAPESDVELVLLLLSHTPLPF